MLGRIAIFGGVIVAAALVVSAAVIFLFEPEPPAERKIAAPVEEAPAPPAPAAPDAGRPGPATAAGRGDGGQAGLPADDGRDLARQRGPAATPGPAHLPARPKPPARVAEGGPPPAAPAADQQAALPRPTALLAAIDPILHRVPCAVLDASLVGGTVNIRGYVFKPEDIDRVKDALRSLDGVTEIRADVERMNDAQCGLVNFFSPYVAANRNRARGVVVRARNPRGRYVQDENLIVDLKAPDRVSYIYVDYFARDGGVVHLMPSPGVPRHRLAADHARSLGDGPGQAGWVIGEPFGTEMIVALSVSEPLFAAPRKEIESAADYLKDLKQGLARLQRAGAQGGIAADVLFITTAPRR